MANATKSQSSLRGVSGRNPKTSRARPGLTDIAFALALILVIVRMTIQENVRGDLLPVPGVSTGPATPGPASGFVLDLLCCLPATLLLARRLIDRTFALRLTLSHFAMFALAGWTLASTLWASDKFLAVVSASHWAAALVLLWSASQLVRTWLRLRVLAAVGFGVLMVLLVQGYYYRFVDLPDFQRDWREHRADLLKQRGAAVDSLEATQIGRNIESGDVTGFNVSRNTYAAVLVLLIVLSAGIVAQRLHDGDRPGWSAPILVIMAAALWMLYRYVQSKTAFATPVIGLILLASLWLRRHWLARHGKALYWSGVGLFALGVAAVVGHGMVHGTLVHISLTFRWWYWVGAARVFAHHPWLGVGWANFGLHYPAYRLPQAAEDPADPHSFLVRAFVELGIVGGVLMVGWMLRLWWELTAGAKAIFPAISRTGADPEVISNPPLQKKTSGGRVSAKSSGIRFLVLICLAAMALNCAVAIDWDQSNSWIFLELFKRALFLMALLTGMSVVAIRSFDRQELDDRPAPLLASAILVGMGLFLIHNLIDFSLFEPGPMFLFALLAGGVLGGRQHEPAARQHSRMAIFVAFILSGVGWIVAAGAGVWDVANAESLAQDADLQVRHNKPERARDEYIQAFHLVPINADYAFRAEQAAVLGQGNPLMMRQLLDAAVEANPASVRYRLARAELEVSINDLSRARADYQQILRLDPNNIDLRLEYAKFLQSHGSPAEAREQYQAALAINNKRLPDEVRKLSPAAVNQIRDAIKQLPP